MAPLRKPGVSLSLSICAVVVAAVSMLTLIIGSSAPGWAHWLCSPGVLGRAARNVHASGVAAKALTALEIHWPHFLPAMVALATLVYLWRADIRHRTCSRAHDAQPAIDATGSAQRRGSVSPREHRSPGLSNLAR